MATMPATKLTKRRPAPKKTTKLTERTFKSTSRNSPSGSRTRKWTQASSLATLTSALTTHSPRSLLFGHFGPTTTARTTTCFWHLWWTRKWLTKCWVGLVWRAPKPSARKPSSTMAPWLVSSHWNQVLTTLVCSCPVDSVQSSLWLSGSRTRTGVTLSTSGEYNSARKVISSESYDE